MTDVTKRNMVKSRKEPKKLTKKQEKVLLKRELTKKDKKWSEEVRTLYGDKCAVCGAEKYIQAHHIIPRTFLQTRHWTHNGIALCARCHKFGRFSAHKNPLWFAAWLKINMQHTYETLCEDVMGLYDEYLEEEI